MTVRVTRDGTGAVTLRCTHIPVLHFESTTTRTFIGVGVGVGVVDRPEVEAQQCVQLTGTN
ncbi:MAG: hypothetical protein WEA35_02150, partial [Candidatus Nanopelagicales bacterium]